MKTSLRKKDTETERQKESHRYIIRKNMTQRTERNKVEQKIKVCFEINRRHNEKESGKDGVNKIQRIV